MRRRTGTIGCVLNISMYQNMRPSFESGGEGTTTADGLPFGSTRFQKTQGKFWALILPSLTQNTSNSSIKFKNHPKDNCKWQLVCWREKHISPLRSCNPESFPSPHKHNQGGNGSESRYAQRTVAHVTLTYTRSHLRGA